MRYNFLRVTLLTLTLLSFYSHTVFSKTYMVSKVQTGEVFSTIAEAMAQAGRGDTVFIEEGIYQERLVLKSGVTVRGSGSGSTRVEYSGKGAVVYGKNVKGGALEDLSITYRGKVKKSLVFLVSSEVSLSNLVMFGASLSGIEARDKSRVRIKNTTVKGNRGSGIFLYNEAKGYVEGSEISGNRYFGIEVKSGALLSSRNNLISENQAGGVNLMKGASLELYGSQVFGNENYGVIINEGSSGKVISNNILGNTKAGILVISGGVSVIQNNIISYNDTGIRIRGDKRPFFSHNNVWNNSKNYENMEKPDSDLSLDPLFKRGYRLKKGSPMIGKGFWGQDIGAFPFEEEESSQPLKVVDTPEAREVIKEERGDKASPPPGGTPCEQAIFFYNKGVALKDFSEDEIGYYKRALQLCPGHYKSHFNLGVVYKKLGKSVKAIVEFKEVLKLKDDVVDAHYNLGEIYDILNNLELAVYEYKEAIRLNPDKLNAHYNLGGVYYFQKKYDKARGELGEALRIDPAHLPSLSLLEKIENNSESKKN